MKRAALTLFAASLFLAVGCESNSKPGGPGANNDNKSKPQTTTNQDGTTTSHDGTTSSTTTTTTTSKSSPSGTSGSSGSSGSSIMGPSDNTFTLDMPNLSTHIKQ